MADFFTDLADFGNKLNQIVSTAVPAIKTLVNPTGSSTGASTASTNGGGIPLNVGVNDETKTYLLVFGLLLIVLVLVVAFK